MKNMKFFFVAMLAACLAVSSSYALIGDSFDSVQSDGIVTDVLVEFPGETRWIDVYEGGSGGGCINGLLRVNIIDEGFGSLPHVTIYNNTDVFMEFDMTPEELAKIYIRTEENGTILKGLKIRDRLPEYFFYKTVVTFGETDCSQQSVPKVQPIGSNPYVGAVFTRDDICRQKVVLI